MSRDGAETKLRKGAYDLVLASADYCQWNGPPRQTLLICTQQRSGSTLLGEAVYFAGGLGCPLEYYHGGFRPSFERRWKTTDIPAYAAALHRYRTDPSGVFSIKLFWWDVAELVGELMPTEFASLSRANASQTDDSLYRRIFAAIAGLFPYPRFVLLTRRDEIRQAVSNSVAAQTGAWRRLPYGHRNARRVSPVYDFNQIVQRLAEIQNDNAHWMNFFRANGLQYHKIVYEDLAADYEPTLRKLFAAVGRPEAPIMPLRLRKQADDYSEELLRRFLTEFHQRAHGG